MTQLGIRVRAADAVELPYNTGVSAETIHEMATSFDVDVKRDWRVDEEFLNLFTKDGLSSLVDEWNISTN